MTTPPDAQERDGLLPCPFCGGERALRRHRASSRRSQWWSVECTSCEPAPIFDRDEMITHANRRAPSPAKADAPVVTEAMVLAALNAWFRQGLKARTMADYVGKHAEDMREAIEAALAARVSQQGGEGK